MAYTKEIITTFQSTLSVRRATIMAYTKEIITTFQSTLSVRRATGIPFVIPFLPFISIHALRKESDPTTILEYITR